MNEDSDNDFVSASQRHSEIMGDLARFGHNLFSGCFVILMFVCLILFNMFFSK